MRNAMGKQIGNSFEVSRRIVSIVEYMEKYHQLSVQLDFQMFIFTSMQVIDSNILQNGNFDRLE